MRSAAENARPGEIVLLVARVRELRPVRRLRGARRGTSSASSPRWPVEARPARVAHARARHARPGRVRARDGLQRDLGAGGARRRRSRSTTSSARRSTRRSASSCCSSRRGSTTGRCAYLAPALVLTSLGLCLAVLVLGRAGQRRAPLARFGSRPSSPRSSPSSRSRSGRPRTSRGTARRRRSRSSRGRSGSRPGSSAGLILLEPDLGTAIAIGDRPRRVLARLRSAAAGPRRRRLDRGRARARRDLVRALPPRAPVQLPRPVERPAGRRASRRVQAMIGFGSGGIFGTGLGQGVAKVNYLPEAHTDMIFAIDRRGARARRRGAVIAAYCAFAYAGLRVALRCRDPFGKRLAAGADDARLRAGAHQSRRGSRARSADRDPAPVRLVRRLEPRRLARLGGRPP